jgi:hypothetical protein
MSAQEYTPSEDVAEQIAQDQIEYERAVLTTFVSGVPDSSDPADWINLLTRAMLAARPPAPESADMVPAARLAEAVIERCRRLHGLEPGYVVGCDECEAVVGRERLAEAEAKVARVEALIEMDSVFLKRDTKIKRVQEDRRRDLGAIVTTSMVTVDDVRAALTGADL